MPSPQNEPRLVLDVCHAVHRTDPDLKGNAMAQPKQLQGGGKRNVEEIILRLPEDGTDGLRHTHHLKPLPLEAEFLAEGIPAGEQVCSDVLPDDADRAPVRIIRVADIASRSERLGADINHVGGHAAGAGPHRLPAVGCAPGLPQGRSHLSRLPHSPPQGVVVLQGQLRTLLDLDPLPGIRDDPETGNHKYFRAELRNPLGDVLVHPLDDGDDRDEGRDRNQDSQQRQEGPEAMSAQVFKSDSKGLPNSHRRSCLQSSFLASLDSAPFDSAQGRRDRPLGKTAEPLLQH